MRFNPCGAKCEMMRRCYRTRIKPFKDSDIEVGIRWYPALPDAPTLPFPSFVTSRDWRADFTTPTPLGEVWDAPRTFYNAKPIPAAKGEHVCGTEDEFRDGQAYEPELNDTWYNADGLPLCCLNEVPVRAGIELWPEAEITGPRTPSKHVSTELWPEAEITAGFSEIGRVSVEVWPEANVFTTGPYNGLVSVEVWPESRVTQTGPDYALSCVGAGTLQFGVTYNPTTNLGSRIERWGRYDLQGGHTYRIIVSEFQNVASINVYLGDCSNLVLQFNMVAVGCREVTPALDTFLLIQVTYNAAPNNGNALINVDEGTCP